MFTSLLSTSCLLPFTDAKTGKQYPVIRKTPLGKKVIFLVVIILVKHFGIYILLRLFWISFCFSYCCFLHPLHLTWIFLSNFRIKDNTISFKWEALRFTVHYSFAEVVFLLFNCQKRKQVECFDTKEPFLCLFILLQC